MREALSARIDYEPEPVPAARVDEHLETCRACATWYLLVSRQAEEMRRLAGATGSGTSVAPAPFKRERRVRILAGPIGARWPRWALGLVGALQLVLGLAQVIGTDFGMLGHPGADHGVHLMNESTAWSLALGAVMIAAALRPTAAAGLAGVLTVFTVALVGYVIGDLVAGLVTPERVLSHLPVLLGTVLALLVWRAHRDPGDPWGGRVPVAPPAVPAQPVGDPSWAATLHRPRRRHLRSVNRSAA